MTMQASIDLINIAIQNQIGLFETFLFLVTRVRGNQLFDFTWE